MINAMTFGGVFDTKGKHGGNAQGKTGIANIKNR